MKTFRFGVLLSLLFCLFGKAGMCATFDERLWEKYAEIEAVPSESKGSFVVLPFDSSVKVDVDAAMPFADLRIVTDRKEEMPWQIVSRGSESREDEISCRMGNMSTTASGDTWIELFPERKETYFNALQITVSGGEYIRQVEVYGSQDGKSWNSLRKDGIVFTVNRGEKLQNSRITIPESRFPHVALKIINNGAEPLNISDVRMLQQSNVPGVIYSISGSVGSSLINSKSKESSVVVKMDRVFPIDRLIIDTGERNFQRSVSVETKNRSGEWALVAEGTLYSIELPSVRSSQLAITLPGVAAREFRLVFRDYDSPPLAINSVSGEGFQRALVFKTYPGRKLYLFWGNPEAEQPNYDLTASITAKDLYKLPEVMLGEVRSNTAFAGDDARRPFTERYKILLYLVVIAAIAGLFLLQYRTFKQMKS